MGQVSYRVLYVWIQRTIIAIEIIGLECGLYCYWALWMRQMRGSKMAADKGQKANLELSCVFPAVPRFALGRPMNMQIFCL